jgi:hypothetical protein
MPRFMSPTVPAATLKNVLFETPEKANKEKEKTIHEFSVCYLYCTFIPVHPMFGIRNWILFFPLRHS